MSHFKVAQITVILQDSMVVRFNQYDRLCKKRVNVSGKRTVSKLTEREFRTVMKTQNDILMMRMDQE